MTTHETRSSAAIIPLRPAPAAAPTSPETFPFDSHAVRVLTIDGEPWFVARDVADVLGYANAADAVARHCKGVVKRDTLTDGGLQEMTIIPERDLYRLIMRSKLPNAERFEEWVVGTVLPAIRKTGSYVRGEEALDPNAPDYLDRLKDLLIAAQERKLAEAHEKLALQAPKVAAQERLAASAGSMSISDAARCLGMKDRKFFAWLQDNRWIFRSKDSAMRPVPYADKRSAGWMEVASSTQQTSRGEIATQSARITAKGLAKLAEIHGVPGW